MVILTYCMAVPVSHKPVSPDSHKNLVKTSQVVYDGLYWHPEREASEWIGVWVNTVKLNSAAFWAHHVRFITSGLSLACYCIAVATENCLLGVSKFLLRILTRGNSIAVGLTEAQVNWRSTILCRVTEVDAIFLNLIFSCMTFWPNDLSYTFWNGCI